jgi:hypothetical protein
MFFSNCGIVETPVELKSLDRRNEIEPPLGGLTSGVESDRAENTCRGAALPSVKLIVRICFAGGEEVLASAETPFVPAADVEQANTPYSFSDATVPERPILVSSSNFIRVD